jgi:probable rRNA maturation factor
MIEVEVLGASLAAGAPTEQRVEWLCELAAASRDVEDGHVAVQYVSAEQITRLNARHRDKDEPTDVLSFPIDGVEGPPAGGPRELGDIVICPRHTADIEEAVVHGMLHLLGMDHETDDGEMLALQDELLRRPQPPADDA